jgi:branched-chain amino acid transport system ATP-binding protein
MPPVLELSGVVAGYGRVNVLRGLDLVVPEGGLVSLVGPNGAGKTTTLNAIAGLIRPTSGTIRLDGRPLVGRRPYEIARAGVCLIPEGRAIFPALTVRENLLMQAERASSRPTAVARVLEYFPRLAERTSQRAGTLSGGEQQMLALARALVTEPRVLLLDEISMGLAPQIVARLFETVEALSADGVSILLVEQYLTYALRLSDAVYVLNKGCVTFVGEPDELRLDGATDLVGYSTA